MPNNNTNTINDKITGDNKKNFDILLYGEDPNNIGQSDIYKKGNVNQEILNEKLESYGFETEYLNGTTEATKNTTRIIYPSNISEGETLPVIVLQAGDNGNNKSFDSYFYTYEDIHEAIPSRAVYVLAGDHQYETVDNNAFIDAQNWMHETDVSASQYGVYAFSNGGGIGTIMASQAIKDDVPVTLYLADAAYGNYQKEIDKYIEELSEYDNITVAGSTCLYDGLLKKFTQKLPDKTYEVSSSFNTSHGYVKGYSLAYNILPIFMGLSNLSDDFESYFNINNQGKKIEFNNILERLSSLLSTHNNETDNYATSKLDLFPVDETISNDQRYVIESMNTIRNNFNKIEIPTFPSFDDPSGTSEIITKTINNITTNVISISNSYKLVDEEVTIASEEI